MHILYVAVNNVFHIIEQTKYNKFILLISNNWWFDINTYF